MKCLTLPLNQIPIKQRIFYGARGGLEVANNLVAATTTNFAKLLN